MPNMRGLVMAGLISVGMVTAALADEIVVLQGLNKITGHVTTVRTVVGQALHYGSLTVLVERALKNQPHELPEVYAFVTIVDDNAPDETPAFSGWMVASSPALSALDHPLYDVTVIDYEGLAQPPSPNSPLIAPMQYITSHTLDAS